MYHYAICRLRRRRAQEARESTEKYIGPGILCGVSYPEEGIVVDCHYSGESDSGDKEDVACTVGTESKEVRNLFMQLAELLVHIVYGI